jgi:hypothetical protein
MVVAQLRCGLTVISYWLLLRTAVIEEHIEHDREMRS